MADYEKEDMAKQMDQVEETESKIRITLTSRNMKAVESVCHTLKEKAAEKFLTVSGPIRMPTKKLLIITRKAPNGEGTNTFDKWTMRIHKRVLDIKSPSSIVKEITSVNIEAGVEVEVTLID